MIFSRSNNVVAESALDRMCCGLGGKSMLGLIVEQVPGMLASEDWRRRHAALMAVSSAGEGCHKQMEQMLDQVVSAVLNYLTDPVSGFLIQLYNIECHILCPAVEGCGSDDDDETRLLCCLSRGNAKPLLNLLCTEAYIYFNVRRAH